MAKRGKQISSGWIWITIAILTILIGSWGIQQGFSWMVKALDPGRDYYVSTSGSNSNPGTMELPFRTVAWAIQVTQAGDKVHVYPGTYPERITVSSKHGTPTQPIYIVGKSSDPALYPVIDGGDPTFTSGTDAPAFFITNSSWLNFERLKIINSTRAGFKIESSHYITIRRNIIDFHFSAVTIKDKSSHMLIEYNDMFQSYPDESTWSQLKSSKWEGGAIFSNGAAGMNVIRNNYFHHAFNGILINKTSPAANYHDANTWIYRNRFENIVDDPYEPEGLVFNNHFFNNTLINTHRLASLAPTGLGTLLGPIYIYNNYQLMTLDPTQEAATTGRINSALKVDLNNDYFTNGVYFFNNSLDIGGVNVNTYGVDTLSSTVRNFTHLNNAYRTTRTMVDSNSLSLLASNFDYDLSNLGLGINEVHGQGNVDPSFASSVNEDGRLNSTSTARGKSTSINLQLGFENSNVISVGDDLGAYVFGSSDFRQSPMPIYVAPPGGEDPTFPTNTTWSEDKFPGINPPSGPKWQTSTTVIPTIVTTIVPQDTTPPSVSINQPSNEASVNIRSTVSILATATDNVGISKVDIFVAGNLVCTTSTPNQSGNYSCDWKVPGRKKTRYIISAKAFDRAGNTSSSTIQVVSR